MYFYFDFLFQVFFQQVPELQYQHDLCLVAIKFHNYSFCNIEQACLVLSYLKHDPYVNFPLH